MSDTVKFKIKLSAMSSVSYSRETVVEVDREEWDDMSAAAKRAYIDEETQTAINNDIGANVTFEDPSDDPA